MNSSQTFYPLSYGQQGLWHLSQADPENIAYNGAFAARVCCPVNVPALRDAFQALVTRHTALRTTFTIRADLPVQVLHEHQTVEFRQIDAMGWSESRLRKQVQAAHNQPFDLERGPLFRVSLFTRAQDEHVLLISVWHAICDGFSMWQLLEELRQLYSASEPGKEVDTLPPITHSYAEYGRWEAQMLQKQGDKLWRYWQNELAGNLPRLALPTDRPRPPIQTYNGASHHFRLSAELTHQLKALAGAEKATLYMLLLAAFQVLMHRYTGQDDILIGTPAAGRIAPEFRKTVGFFSNLLVLRADLAGNPTFKTFLRQIAQTTFRAMFQQGYPFSLLVQKLQPERDPSYSPLVQVVFNFHTFSQGMEEIFIASPDQAQRDTRIAWGDLIFSPFPIAQQEAQFDLSLEMTEGQESLIAAFEYNYDLFDAATIERMTSHFQTLLHSIVSNPEQPVSALSLLSAAEREQLLVKWNDTEADYPKEQCLHQLFEEQVARTPDAIAVIFDSEERLRLRDWQTLTYRQLNARANQLAHYLQAQGVGPETLVGICMERSLDMMVGMLGILKAGGAYVPLDPAYPAERIAFILHDTQTPILLTQAHLRADLPAEDAHAISLDREWDQIATHSATNPVSPVAPHNLAYIIYTSGSTGEPKGVLIEHESVVAHCTNYQRFYGVTAQDRALQLASFHFDASVEQIFPALLAGASVVLPEWELDAESFSHNLQAFGITILDLAGAHWRMLVQEWIKNPALIAHHSLRIVIVGGDVMPADVIPLWRQTPLDENVRLFNVYGPTETTVAATVYEVTHDFDSSQPRIPIGPPLANKKLYVLDQYQQPVPIGVPGELYIGGVGPARGYLHQPQLTDLRFMSLDLAGPESQSMPNRLYRLYRTGDLVRWLPDGNLDFLGRVDDQVKIRGYRIELGEIEAHLKQHPAIHDAVVIVHEENNNQSLVGYIVANNGYATSPELERDALRKTLRSTLPDYMVPTQFVQLDAIPRHSTTGKVIKTALPDPAPIAQDIKSKIKSKSAIAPRTPTEKTIAAIWSDVLGRAQVGVYDDFFALGGHSLLATQINSRFKQAFAVKLPMRDLFEYTTVAELAEHLQNFELVRRMLLTDWTADALMDETEEEGEL